MTAQVDTHPKGGDAVAAPFMGSAVAEGHAPNHDITRKETGRGQ